MNCMKNVLKILILESNLGKAIACTIFLASCKNSENTIDNGVKKSDITLEIYNDVKNSHDTILLDEDSLPAEFLKNLSLEQSNSEKNYDPLKMVSPSTIGPYLLIVPAHLESNLNREVYFAMDDDRKLPEHLKKIKNAKDFEEWISEIVLPYKKSEIPLWERF